MVKPKNTKAAPAKATASKEFGVVKLAVNMVMSWGGDIQVINRDHEKFKEVEQIVDNMAKARKAGQPWQITQEQWLALKRHVDYREAVKQTVQEGGIKGVEINDKGAVLVDGVAVSGRLGDVLGACLKGKSADLGKFVAFARSLARASESAKKNLFNFIEKQGIFINDDGSVLALKIVDNGYKDLYTHKLDNTPGRVVVMDRKKVVEDPERHCAAGLHVCSPGYLHAYGNGSNPTLLVSIQPEHFVSVPSDYNFNKARVQQYTVLQDLGQRSAVQKMGSTLGDMLKKVDFGKNAPLLKTHSVEGAATVTCVELADGVAPAATPAKASKSAAPAKKVATPAKKVATPAKKAAASTTVKPQGGKPGTMSALVLAFLNASGAAAKKAAAEACVEMRKRARKSWAKVGVLRVTADEIEKAAASVIKAQAAPTKVASKPTPAKKAAAPAKKVAAAPVKTAKPLSAQERAAQHFKVVNNPKAKRSEKEKAAKELQAMKRKAAKPWAYLGITPAGLIAIEKYL